MYDPDQNELPFNPIPSVVIALCVFILGTELIFQAGASGYIGGPQAVGWRLSAIENYGFFDTIFNWMIERRLFPPQLLVRFVTYPFIHGNFMHALFVVVFILAIGKMVAEVFSSWAVIVIFFASSIMGALAYGLILDEKMVLIGGYTAVYGLIGAFTFMLWVKARATGESSLRAFSLIGFLLGIQLIFKIFFGGGNDWVAEIAGFCTGFLSSFFLAPGGTERIQNWIEDIRKRR